MLCFLKHAFTKGNLLKYYVRNETNFLYRKSIEDLILKGYKGIALVSDGRKGLIQSFGSIPVQMCQFHQIVIIRRYVTKKHKLPASIDLKELVAMMKLTDRESFEGALNEWLTKWQGFLLNERTANVETGRSYYTHKRLRSAYRSLKSNLPWLFTWYAYIELNIPITTNAIDRNYADLKNKLRNHNGSSLNRKMKFIDTFLEV